MGQYPEKIIHRLCCPSCKHYPLEAEGGLTCLPCSRRYAVSEGIPDFITQETGRWRIWKERLRQFDRRATGWTQENAEERVPVMKDLFGKFHDFEGLLLDIGCGDGEVRSFLKKGSEYWGIDPEDWVTTAKHSFDKEALFPGISEPFPLFLGVGEYLPFRDQTFDHVLIFSSFDHVQSPQEVLRECSRVLKRGGFIVIFLQISDPAYNIPRSKVKELSVTLRRGFSKLPKGDFSGFAKGAIRTLFEKPDLTFTRKEIEELIKRYFLKFEIEMLHDGDAFVRAQKP